MYKHRTHCRACLSTELSLGIDLGVQPLANNFTRHGEAKAGFAPLEVMYCHKCGMAQLSVVVDPHLLYDQYSYVTSPSRMMQTHFAQLWTEILKESVARTVLEIGSNDGRFLDFCLTKDVVRCAGIDPAANLKPVDELRRKSICSLFNKESAAAAKDFVCLTDVIVARHVVGHIDDLQQFVLALDEAAGKETLVVIEVPYLNDMLEQLEFDTIYHEHLSYLSVTAIDAMLEGMPFHLHKVLRFDIHGGAIVIMLRRKDSKHEPHTSVKEYLDSELMLFMGTHWAQFAMGCQEKMGRLELAVRNFKSVCGLGASAKSTVWINSLGLKRSDIQFICDYTPQKIGRESPGTDIPIVPESALLTEQPEAAVMFAWNFEKEILHRHHLYLERGGVFIVAGPNPKVVGLKEANLALGLNSA